MQPTLFWALLTPLFVATAIISLVAVFWRHLKLDFTLGTMMPSGGFGQNKIEDYTSRSWKLFLKSLVGPFGMLIVAAAAAIYWSPGAETLLVPAGGLLGLAIAALVGHRRLEKGFSRESGLTPGECPGEGGAEAREAA